MISRFDIWPTVCEDNLDGLSTLKRRYSRRLNRSNERCWMGAWEEDHLRYLRRQSKREEREWSYWRNPLMELAGKLPKEEGGVAL